MNDLAFAIHAITTRTQPVTAHLNQTEEKALQALVSLKKDPTVPFSEFPDDPDPIDWGKSPLQWIKA